MLQVFNKFSVLWMVRTWKSSSPVWALEIIQLQPCSNYSFHDNYSVFGPMYSHVMHVLHMFSQTQRNPCRFIELFLFITPSFPSFYLGSYMCGSLPNSDFCLLTEGPIWSPSSCSDTEDLSNCRSYLVCSPLSGITLLCCQLFNVRNQLFT